MTAASDVLESDARSVVSELEGVSALSVVSELEKASAPTEGIGVDGSTLGIEADGSYEPITGTDAEAAVSTFFSKWSKAWNMFTSELIDDEIKYVEQVPNPSISKSNLGECMIYPQ
ncbi:MAG: hypothetical protein JST44_22660 [Cyanobacteria bacterium SZAS LIN-5]|nr:hypothetical protein [Cyanobacteria bacterium SZAS LIN-5]